MSREKEKETYERDVFLEFIKMAKLNIDHESIKKGNEDNNEPDILCELVSKETVGFELGRLTDSKLRKAINRWEPKNAEYIRTRDRSKEITKNKLNRKYNTSFPTELILYRENPIITPDNVIIPTIKPICQSIAHNYNKIWYMSKEIEILYEKG